MPTGPKPPRLSSTPPDGEEDQHRDDGAVQAAEMTVERLGRDEPAPCSQRQREGAADDQQQAGRQIARRDVQLETDQAEREGGEGERHQQVAADHGGERELRVEAEDAREGGGGGDRRGERHQDDGRAEASGQRQHRQ